MSNIKIKIKNDEEARVNNSFATAYNYQAIIDGVPNPETPAEHTERRIIEYIKSVVLSQEAVAAAETARQEALKSLVGVEIDKTVARV